MIDFRQILAVPALYRLFNRLVGSDRWLQLYLTDYVRPESGQRILDIGCGPGDILSYLSEVEYFGFDPDHRAIVAAQRRFGKRGTFVHAGVDDKLPFSKNQFDRVMSIGVLHHLNNDSSHRLLNLARTMLKPGGRLITFDCCRHPDNPPLIRFLLNRDRGQFIRTPSEYLALAQSVFPNAIADVRSDVARVPYTATIINCTN